MVWVTFETEGSGLLKVQVQHLVAIYDELGVVKISTARTASMRYRRQ